MTKKFNEISAKVWTAITTYPLVLLMAVIMTSAIIFIIENNHSFHEFLAIKLIICSSLGISVLFSAKMLSQRVGKELLWQLIGLLILIAFYFILPTKEENFDEVYAFVLIPTYILSHLFVSFAAFINTKSEMNFWQFNKNLFINIILAAIFTGVLTLGVNLAILAVENLFNWNFDSNIYAETAAILGIVGNTLIFLLFNEKGLDELEKSTPYPVVLKFFTQFILIPLLLIYVVILYLYTAKIIINWELPQGWVSYLVLAYSMVGILAILLVHPLRNDSAKSWVKIFSKAFYYSLIPLIILLFIAIFTRILEYGYTEPRYYVLLLAIWLLSVQVYFIFFRNSTIKFIPMSLFAFGIFGLLFPYANSFAVAKRSQKFELEKLLEVNKLVDNGKINFDKPISSEVAESISDKFTFLSKRDNKPYLFTYLPDSVAIKEKEAKRLYIRSYFTKVSAKVADSNQYFTLTNTETVHKVNGYDYVLLENSILNAGATLGNDKMILTKNLYGQNPNYTLQLSTGEKADLLPLVSNLMKKHKGASGFVPATDLFIETDLGPYHIKIIYETINQTGYNSTTDFYLENAIYLVKIKAK